MADLEKELEAQIEGAKADVQRHLRKLRADARSKPAGRKEALDMLKEATKIMSKTNKTIEKAKTSLELLKGQFKK